MFIRTVLLFQKPILQPRKVHLSPEMFSVENNLLTPTFKSKRLQISKRYAEQIDTMYQDLD